MKNKPIDQPISSASEKPNYDEFFTSSYKKTAARLERVLASEKVSPEVKNILEALVAEAAIEAGFSIPDTENIAGKFPKIFESLAKSASPFYVLYHAIETALNHGVKKSVE